MLGDDGVVRARDGFSRRGGFSAVMLYLTSFISVVVFWGVCNTRMWCCGGVHSIKMVRRYGRWKVDVVTHTRIGVPWNTMVIPSRGIGT